MNVLAGLTKLMGTELFREIKEGVMAYFPPDMSPQQKLELELKLQSFLHEKQMEAAGLLHESAAALDRRIAEQEGTAKDLHEMPILGSIMLFLRGMQRPTWGFATLWIDSRWFFGAYSFTEQQQTALIVINVLVLGFLFGERAVLNLSPLIERTFGGKK